MLKCSIGKEQQINFGKKVAVDLKKSLETEEAFDIQSYMKGIYDTVMSVSQDNEARALDYARLVPVWVVQFSGLKPEVRSGLIKQGISFDALYQLVEDISDPESGLAKVKEYLEIANDSSAIKDMGRAGKRIPPKKKKKEPKKESGETPVTSPSIWQQATKAVQDFFKNIWQSYAPTAFADAGLEAPTYGKDKDVPYTDNRKFLYKVKRNLIKALQAQPDGMDSSQIDYEGFGPVQLTIMSVRQIEDQLGNDIDMSHDPDRTGVFMVITDQNGDLMKFDASGNPTLEGGNIAYYLLRNNAKSLNEQGQYIATGGLAKSDTKKIDALAKLRKISKAKAKAQFIRELQAIDDIRKHIAADPDNNTVATNITGGSLGVVDENFKIHRNSLSKSTESLSFRTADATDQASGRGMKEGFTYFFTENGQPLQVERPVVGVNSFTGQTEFGNVDMLLDLITGDLKDEFGNSISYSKRKELVEQYLPLQSKKFNLPDKLSSGKYWLTLYGERHMLDTPQQVAEARAALKKYLTEVRVEREITENQARGKKKVRSIQAGKVNDVLETSDGKFFLLDQSKLHIPKGKANDSNANIEKPILTKNDDGSFSYRIEEQRYADFIKENFYSSAEMSSDGKFRGLNAYFTYAVPDDAQKSLYPKAAAEAEPQLDEGEGGVSETNPTIAPDVEPDVRIDNVFDREGEADKILSVKQKDKPATKKQIAEAKVWYENHIMNDSLKFKEAFNLVNTKRPNAVATFAMSGITLYKNSDYSDLYHEAWHGFSQAFMNPEQRKALYKETRNKSGDFTTYAGKVVSFNDAKDKELEEWLAEEFRSFMLSGQKPTKGAPKKNSLFRRIFNFLKALFNNTTIYEIGLNEKADKNIQELFNKLRVGDLNEYSFSADNVQFGELESGILSLEDRDGVNQINIEDSNTINESLDAIFGEFIDLRNTGLNIKEQNELAKLKAQFAGGFYKKLPAAERAELIKADKARMLELSTNAEYKGVSDIVKNDKVRMKAYNYAHYRLKQIRDQYTEAYENETNELKKGQIGKDLELLNFTLREFGKFQIVKNAEGKDVKQFLDLESQLPKAGEPVRGVIANHMFKSKLFSDAELLEFEDMDEVDTFLKGREGYNRSGTENSLKALAKQDIIYLIQGLKATDKNGKEVLNRFGIPKLQPFTATWNRLARSLQNSPSLDVMYDKLEAEAKISPQVKQLLERLGPNYRDGISMAELNVWTNFWQAFNKTRVPLIQMTVTREQTGQGTIYTSTIGEAFNADYAIGKRWESQFQGAREGESKYIKRDSKGNYLDIDKVLTDFPEEGLVNKSFEFYEAIGFDLTDTPEIRKALIDNKYRFGPIYFRNELVKLKTKKNRKGKVERVRSLYTVSENLDKRFKALQILEAKFSDLVSNFMVTNAENNTQFEHTLNNTMTVMVNGLNDTTKDYNEIVAQRHLSHLDIEKNPFSEASVWLKSMFVLDVPKDHADYGTRRKNEIGDFVTLRLTNLSGVRITDKDESSSDGIAAAKSDAYTKLILDLHLSYFGTPEMMRHADKGTSYSLSIDGPIIGSDSKQYVPAYLFTEETRSDYTMKTYNRVLPHIIAEMKRMREMRNLGELEEYDFQYAEDGQNFTIFDDVLDAPTIKLLENIVDGEQDIAEVLNNNLAIRGAIQEQVSNYFDVQYNENKKLFKDANFTTSSAIKQIQSEARKKGINMNDAAAKDALIRSYTNNNFIHNVESLAMFYGDLALYNHAKEGFHKRNAGAGSTGDLYRTDSAMQNYMNGAQVKGTSYAKKNQERLDLTDAELGAYDGTFATAIVKDQNMKSVYYDDYVEELGVEGAAAYGEKNGEGQMTEADAQGLITFDAYRELKIAEGDWSKVQDKLFQDIVNGKRINPKQVKEFFPVVKAQYWGPLQTKGMSLMGMHKYSLMPLIPSVVKGKNAAVLHDKMIKEGIKYLTFESGSKVSTITKKDGPDLLYSKDRTLALDKPFTKNVIHLEYLKNQLAISSKAKGNVIFSTQLRKLIEDGLMEGGVPTDFMSKEKDIVKRIQAWDKIKDKEAESSRYKLLIQYERNIAKLTQYQKDKLLKEMNWTSKIVNGKEQLDGNISDLVKMVKRELGSRDELAQHELDFIDISKGELKYDLSLSLSVEKIEKILNALMVKRLIKQKVNGEGLIQVASTLFEEMNGAEGYNFTNASEEDNKKYNGTNDLPTYQKGKGKNGETSAMKVKVALLGDFQQLLDLSDLDGNRIGDIKTLNELIRNDAWLDEGRHREMITMVGVRIPVQGLNSMEFMEVYEFLPAEAGSVIIPPSEIVAKSGADFDVDKMTIMMPNIRKAKKERGTVVQQPQMWNWSKEELQENYDKYLEAQRIKLAGGEDQSVDSLLAALWGVAKEDIDAEIVKELDEMVRTGEVKSFEDFKKEMLSDKAIQNDLITNIRSILALPENFESLVRPNSTDIFDDLAQELGPLVNDYNQYDTVHGTSRMNGDKKMISPTRTLEVGYNLFKHASNAIGKETLGLGAVDNTYNSVFNRIGMYMNPTAGMTTEEFLKESAKSKPDANKLAKYHRQKLFLTHNNRKVGDELGISLSHIKDANGEHRISDVINQMMNGWVDIAADAWIFNIQGNKEVSPTLLFMIQAGVPVKEAVYFSSMPLVREYVKEQKLAKSTFAQPLNKAPEKPAWFRSKSRAAILTNPRFGFDMTAEDAKYPSNILAAAETKINDDVLNDKGTFDVDTLRGAIIKESEQRKAGETYEYTDVDRAAFLHFLEIEEMSKAVRDIKMKMNVDTSKDGSLFEAQSRIFMKEDLRKDARIPTDVIDRILTDSPIGSFFIQPFQIESLGKMFPLRNNKAVNEFIMNKLREKPDLANDTSGDVQKFANDFKNDLPLYLFQNAIRGVDIKSMKFYNGYAMKASSVKSMDSLKYGAYVDNGVLYIDKAELNRQFADKSFQETSKFGLAKVPSVAFQKPEEYYKFVLERETLRASATIADIADTILFKNQMNFAETAMKQKEEETTEAFEKRKVQFAYESWLKDKALDNAYNYWNMFKSNNTYAQQYESIKKAHPDIERSFELIRTLSMDVAPNNGFKNLTINNTSLTVDEIDQLHENLVNLSDPAKFKEIVDGKSEDEVIEITEFFKKMSVVAFLQSGMNTRSKYSLVRIVPQKPIMDIMATPVKGFMEAINNEKGKYILPEFLEEFKTQNSLSSRVSKIRGKNYYTGTTVSKKGWIQKGIDVEKLDLEYSSGSLYNPNQTTYDPNEGRGMLTQQANDNPNTLYVYNHAMVPGGANIGDTVLSGLVNGYGLTTKARYTEVSGQEKASIIRDKDGAVDPVVKEAIDENITMLEQAQSQGMNIVFNQEGYGQDMLQRNKAGNMFAPKTFVYLSEQLLERLDYLNPKFVETGTGRKTVQAKQEVSDIVIVEKNDQAVRDFMNQCMG